MSHETSGKGEDRAKNFKLLRRPFRVLFLHGREGNPHGSKATWLRESFQATVPSLDTSSIEAARAGALEALDEAEDGFDLLVGSSFGGALVMLLVSEGHWDGPVVLLAPAVRLVEGLSFQPSAPCVVVQGRNDVEVICEDVMERFTGEGSDVFLIQGPWEHRLEGALEDGSIRRAMQWALGEGPLSSPEERYARALRRASWPEESPPKVVTRFQTQVERARSLFPQHPLVALMDAVAEGQGLSPEQPLTGATVAEAHGLLRAVGWVFHGNRARNIEGGFSDRLYVGPKGGTVPTMVLYATFPGYYDRKKDPADVR